MQVNEVSLVHPVMSLYFLMFANSLIHFEVTPTIVKIQQALALFFSENPTDENLL